MVQMAGDDDLDQRGSSRMVISAYILDILKR
jgi:hypothetical protein